MELGDKEKLLRTLRSDITGLELRTNHVNMSPFDKSDEGSDESASPSYKDDIIIYTHDDMVSSLTKQLEIQREVTNICERDLQYRTEIIELLSSRIIELEAESHSWKEQKKSFTALKEKMMYLEQLYGGDGARELEISNGDEPVAAIPDGQTLIDIEALDLLKRRLESSQSEMEVWRTRIATLEGSFTEEREKHAAFRSTYATLEETYRSYQASSTEEMAALQTRIDELLALRTQIDNRNTELMASLDSATEQIKQLTLDIGVAEEMRNASLQSASVEAQDYANLRGRLTELEGQLNMSRDETDGLAVKLESTKNLLSGANEKLTSSESRLKELETALASARSEIASLEASMAEASATSSESIANLESKLAVAAREGEERTTSLQCEIDAALVERDQARGEIAALESRIGQYEAEKEERDRRIVELESTSTTLSKSVSDLEAELLLSKAQYNDLVNSSESNEAASSSKLAALREEAAADAQTATIRITELESEIIIIKERCTHHTAELSEANASIKELEAAKASLAETNERVTELEDQLLEAEGRAGGFDAQLSEAQEKIQEYEAQQTGHSEAIESMKKEHTSALAEYEGRLSEMTSGAASNASRHASLENEVAALTGKISSLDGDLVSAKSENEVLVTRLSAVDSDLATAKSDCDALISKVSALDDSLASAKNENDALMSKLSALDGDLTSAKAENDALKADFEQKSKSAQEAHDSALAAVNSRTKELEELLSTAEEARKLLERQLADTEQSTSSTQSQSTESQARLEASLKEAEEKCTTLQNDVEEKSTLLGELELRVIAATDLESKLEQLKKDHEDAAVKAVREKDELQAQMAIVNVQVTDIQQRETDLKFKLEKALAEVSQRQARIEVMEKETREQGGRSSVDESHLQDLYAEHERQITQMEQDYDELRIERDGIIAERDDIIEERDSHHSRIEELEKRIQELESNRKSSTSLVSSPIEMSSGGSSQSLMELQAKLQESEQKRAAAERALMVRSYSNDSEASDRSRDSMIIVESVDEHGNSEIHEVQKLGSDAGSDAGSDHTADHSTMATSISMASTTSSVAEHEAAVARAEEAQMEFGRRPSITPGKDGEEKTKHRMSLFRHESTKSTHSSHSSLSIASALSGASRMVGSIGHGEGHHLFPERSRKSSEHSHHSHHGEHDEHHEHHDMSNPFLLFAGRSRTDSMRSQRSVSGSSKSGSGSFPVPNSPPSEPNSPAKTTAMAERERKAKDKLEKAEKERAEKAAKVEKERAHKAEKAAKREQERLEREQKEKDRKARLKADPNGMERLTALRQGAGNFYETN